MIAPSLTCRKFAPLSRNLIVPVENKTRLWIRFTQIPQDQVRFYFTILKAWKLIAETSLFYSQVPAVDFDEIKQSLHSLSALIPDNEFYKYNDLWSRSTQQAVFLIIFQSYLTRGEIINIIPVVEETLGGKIVQVFCSITLC